MIGSDTTFNKIMTQLGDLGQKPFVEDALRGRMLIDKDKFLSQFKEKIDLLKLPEIAHLRPCRQRRGGSR